MFLIVCGGWICSVNLISVVMVVNVVLNVKVVW